jgi:hypothetical protein
MLDIHRDKQLKFHCSLQVIMPQSHMATAISKESDTSIFRVVLK